MMGFIKKQGDDFYFLLALSFFLGAVEAVLPRPIPFFRLGLANLPLLLALSRFSTPQYFLLALCKVVGSGYLGGTLFSVLSLFALGGTFASAVVMRGIYFLFGDRVSLSAVSCVGAFFHSLVQVGIASVFVFGEVAWNLFLPILVVGQISAWFFGAVASHVSYATVGDFPFLRGEALARGVACSDGVCAGEVAQGGKVFSGGRVLLGCAVGVALYGVVVFFIIESAFLKLFLAISISLINLILFKNWKSLVYSTITFTFILIFNLWHPMGKVIFSLGSWSIGEQSLLLGIGRGAFFVGLVQFSKLTMIFFNQFGRSKFFYWFRIFLEHPVEVLSFLFGDFDGEDKKGFLGRFFRFIVKRKKGLVPRGSFEKKSLKRQFLMIGILFSLFSISIIFNFMIK